jgi:biopolymer transport protein ExbD
MNYLLEVCLVALTLSISMMPSISAHLPAAARAAQELRRGISVRLAATHNAVPMPDADQAGSVIVSVTRNGRVFLGIEPVSPAVLADSIKAGRPRNSGKKSYIKADARAPYASVAKVLNAFRSAGDESIVLLTGQRVTLKTGTPAPPYGLAVLPGPPSGDGSLAVVQLDDSCRRPPTLTLNSGRVPWSDLQSSLQQALKGRKKQVVLVKAAGSLPYADVVHVIDVCHSLGARAALVTQGLSSAKAGAVLPLGLCGGAARHRRPPRWFLAVAPFGLRPIPRGTVDA